MDAISFSFPVESFRKLPSPYKNKEDEASKASYVAVCNVKHLPTDIPVEQTNPRGQNLDHQVAKQIIKSFQTDINFWVLNRGIVVCAESASFDNSNNKLTITLTNLEKHGNVDGGHTYKVINQYKEHLGQDGNLDEQFVRLEIVTGAEGFFEQLSQARNTSKQVELTSMSELKNKFDVLKDALKDSPFLDEISFKEFEDNKRIDVKEVVAIACMFNRARYSDKEPPVVAYSGKMTCLKQYIKDVEHSPNEYQKMANILADVFRLYSYIDKKMPEAYQTKVGKGAKYGKVKGVIAKKGTTIFTNEKIEYENPKGFIYPILSAFRALVEEENGMYKWAADPFAYFDQLGEELVYETIERSRTLGHNPQSVGKDSGHWGALYSKVEGKLYKQKFEQLQKTRAA